MLFFPLLILAFYLLDTLNDLEKGSKSKGVELEDVKFHQCVRLSRFENDRTISFIPPDGEFELMSYRLNTTVKPLIWIEPTIERYSHSRVEYMIKAKSQFKKRSTANNVEIIVPVPSDADGAKFKTSTGYCKYTPENNCIVWTIKSFPGGKDYLMRAHFNLPSISSEDTEGKPPVQVKFEIPYFTTSGIQVDYFLDTRLFEKWKAILVYWPRLFLFVCLCQGSISENNWKIGLSSPAMGQIHNAKRRLSNTCSIIRNNNSAALVRIPTTVVNNRIATHLLKKPIFKTSDHFDQHK